MTTTKVLKIKVGTVYINKENHDVYQEAWQKTAKSGKVYYEIRTPVWVQEVERKEFSGSGADDPQGA